MEFSSYCSCFGLSITTPKSARMFSSCLSIFMCLYVLSVYSLFNSIFLVGRRKTESVHFDPSSPMLKRIYFWRLYPYCCNCNTERSEGSVSMGREMLRCAQHDSVVLYLDEER